MLPTALTIKGQTYRLPIFCPDATRGVVRGLNSQDLAALEVAGVIVNTWHLGQFPGVERLTNFGGIKKLMGYSGLVISDSGGFQVHSLFHRHPDFGKITPEGLVTYTGPKKQVRKLFRPEDSIAVQFALGSDIIICLDDYTPPTADEATARLTVQRTLNWARRCRAEYDRQLASRGGGETNRPLLFGVIQGGPFLQLRQQCAAGLLELGVDGFGLGGAQFLPDGHLDLDWTAANAQLTPDRYPRYALGCGKPDEMTALLAQGYRIFDCVLPTRDARHGRFYIHPNPATVTSQNYQFLDIGQSRWASDFGPLDPRCSCPTCQQVSRAYLHHLFKIKDLSFARLATRHNVYFFTHLFAKTAESNSGG